VSTQFHKDVYTIDNYLTISTLFCKNTFVKCCTPAPVILLPIRLSVRIVCIKYYNIYIYIYNVDLEVRNFTVLCCNATASSSNVASLILFHARSKFWIVYRI